MLKNRRLKQPGILRRDRAFRALKINHPLNLSCESVFYLSENKTNRVHFLLHIKG